jgi:YfiH family protein
VQAAWGSALRCRGIAAPHLFSSRALQLRANPDGWAELAVSVGVSNDRLLRPKQVHGNDVVVVRPETDLAATCATAADIIMTGSGGAAVTVQVADCVPILLFDPRSGAVAAAHAGWRGTAAGVARTAVEQMSKNFGSRPADLVAAIGPSIGPCCYAVGEDVLAAFGAEGRRWFFRLAGGWILNLWSATRDQLNEAGLAGSNVHVAELCTAVNASLFESVRRDGPTAGRMAAVIRSAPGTRA